MRTTNRLLVPALAAALAAAGTAQEAGKDSLAAAREAFAALQELQKAQQDAMAEVGKGEPTEEARAKLRERMREMRPKLEASRKAFVAAFTESDWSAWGDSDADLLRDGLAAVAFEGDRETPDRTLKACKMFLERFSDSPMAPSIRIHAMTNACLAAGKPQEAIDSLEQALESASDPDKVQYLIAIGDVLAAQGDRTGAIERYESAREGADERAKSYVELRLALVGQPAPEIDSDTWIGGEPKALSKHAGKVVIVDFWATWCGPCRMVMPALDKLYKERAEDGLVVIGVTREYPNGYLPANSEQMLSGGESVRDLDSEAFLEHVKAFKANTGISYPFVVATEDDFKAYKVRGIPTLAVIDQQGSVAMVAVGSGSEAMVRTCVDTLLRGN